jgi:hypothetical protein
MIQLPETNLAPRSDKMICYLHLRVPLCPWDHHTLNLRQGETISNRWEVLIHRRALLSLYIQILAICTARQLQCCPLDKTMGDNRSSLANCIAVRIGFSVCRELSSYILLCFRAYEKYKLLKVFQGKCFDSILH